MTTGIPENPDYSFELIGKNKEVRWRPGQELPKGFRYKLVNSKVNKMGLAGGHTRESWDESRSIYNKKIDEINTETIRFRFPGGGETVELSKITYEWDKKAVAHPKTIFEGKGTEGIENFERALSIEIAEYFRKKGKIYDNLIIEMSVIGKNSKKTKIKVIVKLEDSEVANPEDISISTWFIAEDNFNNKVIKK